MTLHLHFVILTCFPQSLMEEINCQTPNFWKSFSDIGKQVGCLCNYFWLETFHFSCDNVLTKMPWKQKYCFCECILASWHEHFFWRDIMHVSHFSMLTQVHYSILNEFLKAESGSLNTSSIFCTSYYVEREEGRLWKY